MPIFRIDGKLHYFAHVPKCGGASVEHYILDRFGSLAFRDTKFMVDGRENQWPRSAPQHVDWDSLVRIIPEDWLESVFMVVRHPVAKVVSAYHFIMDVDGDIPVDVGIDDWFEGYLETGHKTFGLYDNHMLPQNRFAPKWATVFALESGLDRLIPHLDALAGKSEGPREIEHRNLFRGVNRTEKAVPSDRTRALIREYYAEDYDRFGYPDEVGAPLGAVTVASRQAPANGIGALQQRVKRKLRKLIH